MFNEQLIASHALMVRASVDRLHRLAALPPAEFRRDPDHYAIAEHHLRRAIQALLDLGRHVVVKSGWGNPANYREVFELLERGGVLAPEFASRVKGIAGYRNRLVHDYARVSEEEMWEILQERLEDLETLLEKLLAWIAEGRH
jgi:uncharacterized protein YutE (UPF0331/DUF86 family)